MCGVVKVEGSRENDKTETDEKSLILEVFVFRNDFDWDAILLGYPRCAENTEKLHRHYWKFKNPTFPSHVYVV